MQIFLTRIIYIRIPCIRKSIKADLKYLDSKIFLRTPKTKKDIQKLSGILNWYRNFIPKMSVKIYSLTDMLKDNNNGKIFWTDKHQEILDEITKIIKENIELAFPDYNKKFFLQCDASQLGMRSVLYQENGMIGYYSYKFSDSEKNYTIVEKELFKIVKSLSHFRNITQGYFIEVFTDSKNCTFENSKISSRLERWKIILNDFNIELKTIDGDKNVIADKLSRLYSLKDDGFTKENFIADIANFVELNADKNDKMNIKNWKIDSKNRIIVKNNNIQEFLKYIHNTKGHNGKMGMFYNLKDHFYMKNMHQNICEIVNDCTECMMAKNNRKTVLDKTNKIYAKFSFEKISSDIFGPFDTYNNKTEKMDKGFLITITDIYSRFTWIKSSKKIKGNNIINLVRKWIEKFGKPNIFISDNGTQCTSSLLKNYLVK